MTLLENIASNRLVTSAIRDQVLFEKDFVELAYEKHWENMYTFKNILIGNIDFKSIYIKISTDGIFVNLLTKDTTLYDDSMKYFGTDGISHQKEPYIDNNRKLEEYRKKLGKFPILDKIANVSVLKSEAYGCVLKLTVIL